MRTARRFFFAFWIAEFHCALTQATHAQTLPTTEKFGSQIKECVVSQNVALRSDLIDSLISIYSAQRSNGAPSFIESCRILRVVAKGHQPGGLSSLRAVYSRHHGSANRDSSTPRTYSHLQGRVRFIWRDETTRNSCRACLSARSRTGVQFQNIWFIRLW